MWTDHRTRPMRPRFLSNQPEMGGGLAPSLSGAGEQTASAGAAETGTPGSRERSGREAGGKQLPVQPRCQPD